MAQKFVTPVTIRNLASASSDGLAVSVDGDTNDRIKFEAGGRVVWGSGASAGDVNLYRSAVGALKTDHTFEAESGIITLTTTGEPVASVADGALAVDTTNDDLYFRSNGAWKKVDNVAAVSDAPPSNPQEGDIWFESDTGDFFIYYSGAWVDIGGSSVANIAVTTTPPASPVNGDLWFDTDTAKTYVYYNDGTSGQWVEIGAASAAAAGTDGAIQFASGGTFSSDASNLVWDDTNNRLGIGTTTPEDSLHIKGNAQVVELEGTDHVYVGFYPDGHAAGRKAYVGFGGTDPHFYVTNEDTGNLYASSGSSSISLLSNGNIGINDTSPSFPLDVAGTGRFTGELNVDGGFVKIGASETNEGGELQLLRATSYTQDARIDNYADTVRFLDNTTVRATLGLTNGNFTITGSSYSVGGVINTGSSGGESPFYITRSGDTGQSMKMYTNDRQSYILAVQDEVTGTTSLHLGVDSSTPTGGKVLYIQNCEMQILDGRILPSPDGTRDLGASSLRWNTVFAASGSINTSDVRDKTDINDLDYGLQFVNNLRPVSYKFNDRCGYVGTRTHMGFIAQEVASVLGEEAGGMGVWTNSAGEVDAEGNEFELERQGLRYDELIAPMVKAIQELTARIEALEAN